MASGSGVKTWVDGSKYTGEFLNDKANGKGVLIWPEGKYEGYFKNDRFEGKGTEILKESQYSGQFYKGKKHGKGAKIWKNKTKYVGDFR